MLGEGCKSRVGAAPAGGQGRGVGAPTLAAPAAPEGALGIYANISANFRTSVVSCSEIRTSEFEEWKEEEFRKIRRAHLLELQRASAKLWKLHQDEKLRKLGIQPGPVDSRLGYRRVTQCLWSVWSRDGVQLLHSAEYGRATYKGLVTCGSWSACPVCGSKIAEARRLEFQTVVAFMRSRGYVVAMVTLTLRHKSGDDLGQLVDWLLGVFDEVKKDRIYGWSDIEKLFGIVAPGRRGLVRSRIFGIRAFECTHGYNGWHPHLHILMFLRSGSDVEIFGRLMRDAWYEVNGGEFELRGCHAEELLPVDRDMWERGCTVTCNDADVADYISKFGRPPRWDVSSEIAMSHRKLAGGGEGYSKHYTPLELLNKYLEEGDEEAGRLWLEFGEVMFRRNMTTWSPGLREFVGLGREQTDEEVAEDTHDYKTLLALLSSSMWSIIRTSGRRAELLDVADVGDVAKVDEWLSAWCRPPGPPGPFWGRCGPVRRGVCDGSQ